ncbi:DUF930 domain-containing protein [Microvirga rosea]|uniref:DUF930 domain-containing protein n=1 Tax=Microvirga rosea TaxID=2715425 RepID=UPI001D0B5EA7|nr:DUF930 domain-containing protein [Microvirga rosea]MCB8821507.1 DUF930 domain-containing protein [Microvirga rosea]
MQSALASFDAETRIEQHCGIEAMAQIAALTLFQPDRVVAYAMADVARVGNTLTAQGAAFRSGRRWYKLAFICELTHDHRAIQAFEFTIGDPIPRRLWEAHSLPPVH